MPNLTIVNQQYPPEVVSTGQIFSVMAEYLQANGWNVTVATGTPYYPGMHKAPRREIRNGVTVRRLWNTTFPKRSFLGKFFNLLTFEISLLLYCVFHIKKDQTVLVATAPPMAVLCTAVGKCIHRYRVVMTVQDLYPDILAASGYSSPDRLSYRFLHALMQKAMRSCDHTITISTQMQKHLESAYGLADVEYIPNLFPENIHPVGAGTQKAKKGWEDKIVIQYSGNFGVAHEYETLLGAVRLLKDDSSFLFQIAGSGRNYDKMKEICLKESLPNIVFEGYAPLDKLEEHLGTADIAVVIFSERYRDVLLPSKYYGILASGRGTLLISGCESDISLDIQNERIGCVIQHGQSDLLVQMLHSARENPDVLEQMGRRAREVYDRKYAQKKILAAYDKALLEE